ncbi:hypothetical protein AB0H71_33605 [Nocardia sp. NPDC050697]|uniref:hypothetical protein n=1 Tax=Nocardia sp. NPDC050697 TaxID=3155158 RepID=UPI00340E6DB5
MYTLPTAAVHSGVHSGDVHSGEGVHPGEPADAPDSAGDHSAPAPGTPDAHSGVHSGARAAEPGSAPGAGAPAGEPAAVRRATASAETDAAALAALGDKARQIRFACVSVPNPTPAAVGRWLAERGVTDISRTHLYNTVKTWNAEHAGRPRPEPFTPSISAAEPAEDVHMVDHSVTTAPAPAVHTRAERLPVPAADVHPAPVDTPAAVRTDVHPEPGTGTPADSAGLALPTDEETAELAQRVARARGRLAYQGDRALLEALSEEEIAADRALAERERAAERQIRQATIDAKLRRLERERKDIEAEAREESSSARWHRRAVAKRRRLASPDARLAVLYRRSELIARALVAVVVIGMIWSGVNVQRNLVPSGDMSEPLFWLSFGLEAMISVPLIAIMLTTTDAGRENTEQQRGKVIAAELALLALTITLNTGPHIAAGDLGRAAEFAIAPVMVGVVIWVHSWASGRYSEMILGATPADERPGAQTTSTTTIEGDQQ